MAAAYDHYDYPSYWKGREYEHECEVIALKTLLGKIPKIVKIADIGCGFGRLLPYYLYRAKSVILTDPSSKLLRQAKANVSTVSKLRKRKPSIKIMQSTIKHINDKIPPKSL